MILFKFNSNFIIFYNNKNETNNSKISEQRGFDGR